MKEARVSKRALVLAVSQDAKKVSQQQVYWNSKCNRNVVFPNNTVLHNIAINGGTYTKSKKLSYTLSDGTAVVDHVTTHGTFKHKKKKFSLSGDWRVKSDLTPRSDPPLKCDTGKVTFKATTG